MGILDEAIREHLDLKRAHGAEEAEVKDLESEAFGPADRPDAVSAADPSISPGSSITTPAGEGDQLDKVFKHETAESAVGKSAADIETVAETKIIPAPDAEAEAETTITPSAPVQLGSEAEAEPKPEVSEAAASEAPQAKPSGKGGDDDAGDLLEAERSHLSGYPTEHYDVDAAIAEEDEIDLLSESSLSDELDRALDGPPLEVSEPEITDEVEIKEEPEVPEPVAEADSPSSGMDRPEPNFDLGPETRDPQLGQQKEPEPDPEPEAEFEPEFESAPEEAVEGEAAETENDADADFFDQDDVLEATPEFLEETPEHDRLWFEQKEPKDFDFGD